MQSDRYKETLLETNTNRLQDAIRASDQSLLNVKRSALFSSGVASQAKSPSRSSRHRKLVSELHCAAKMLASALWNYVNAIDEDTKQWCKPLVLKSELDDTLITRAQTILLGWRRRLDIGIRVSCPDWMDEFEEDEESSGLVKQYTCVVKDIATNGNQIMLGDSSQEKTLYALQAGETAILVSYSGFPNDQNQWILLQESSPIATHLLPLGSHRTALKALQGFVKTEEKGSAGYLRPKIVDSSTNNELHMVSEVEGDLTVPVVRKVTPTPTEESSVGRISTIDAAAEAQESIEKDPQPPPTLMKTPPFDQHTTSLATLATDALCTPIEKHGNAESSVNEVTVANGISPKDLTVLCDQAALLDNAQKLPMIQEHDPLRNRAMNGNSSRALALGADLKGASCDDRPLSSERPSCKRVRDDSSKQEDAGHPPTDKPQQKAMKSLEPAQSERQPKLRGSKRRREKPPNPTISKTSRAPSKKKSSKDQDFVWICMECKEAESITFPEALLIICEGKCNRPFHTTCAGLSCPPAEEETWICGDCIKKEHRCGFCQEYGVDDDDVFLCERKGCGMFFHESCLRMQNVDVRMVPKVPDQAERYSFAAEGEGKIIPEDDLAESTVPVFSCPAHQCWACTDEYVPPSDNALSSPDWTKKVSKKKTKRKKGANSTSYGQKKEMVYRCLECPIAYHSSCIPPTSRFHELAILCHEHSSSCKLPDLDMATSFQAGVEADADKKLAKRLSSSTSGRKKRRADVDVDDEDANKFFSGMRGNAVVSDEEKLLARIEDLDDGGRPISLRDLPFCLPCDFVDQVQAKPPSYKHLHTPRYDPCNRPPRDEPTGNMCECKAKGYKRCGEDCLNKMLMVECVGFDESNTKKNPYHNCQLGSDCGNRSLSQRKVAKCKPKREQGKGWGLVTINGVKRGHLVQEYVGEVINQKETERRLEEWAKEHPNDPNFYIMALDTGWYIDARLEANLARFVNHSCDPNCILKRYNVNGYIRIGIFALEDIKPGEFLSYDYQFDTNNGDKFLCRCGAQNCRGTMKGGKENEKDDKTKKSKSDQWKLARARYDRDAKFLEDVAIREQKHHSQVDLLVPAADYPYETVASGPQNRFHYDGTRPFLWRNVVYGADFASRVKRKRRTKPSKLDAKPFTQVDVLALFREANGQC